MLHVHKVMHRQYASPYIQAADLRSLQPATHREDPVPTAHMTLQHHTSCGSSSHITASSTEWARPPQIYADSEAGHMVSAKRAATLESRTPKPSQSHIHCSRT